MFKKILIANRGEIAVRIIRACREMGITSTAVFSAADRVALHVRLADEAYPIGAAPSRESYLRVDRILEAAKQVFAEQGLRFLARDGGNGQGLGEAAAGGPGQEVADQVAALAAGSSALGGIARAENWRSKYKEIAFAVVPAECFEEVVGEWAHKVATKSPLLMRLGKNAIDATRDMSLPDALEALRAQLALAFTTEDIVEGVAAFREKREAVWKMR